MKKYSLFSVAALLMLCGASPAFQASAKVTPAEVEEAVLAANRDVEQARLMAAVAEKGIRTATVLNDPEIEGEYLFGPSGVENRWNLGATWSFDWPGAYGARRGKARAAWLAAESEVASVAAAKRMEIRSAILGYVAAKNRCDVLEKVLQVTDSMLLVSEKAAATRDISRLDVNKLRIEKASLVARIAEASDALAEAEGVLAMLNGGAPVASLAEMETVFPPSAPAPLEDYLLRVENAPSVASARFLADAAVQSARAERLSSLPDFSVGYRHAFEEGTHFNGAALGLSVPLFSGRGKNAEGKAEIEAAGYSASSAAIGLRESIRADYRRLEKLNRHIAALIPVFDGCAGSGELLMKAYKGGEMTLIEYLSESNYFLEARLDYISLQYEAAMLLARIETSL